MSITFEGKLTPEGYEAVLRVAYTQTQRHLAALISDLGGEVTIPAQSLTAARAITVEWNKDGSVTLRVGDEP